MRIDIITKFDISLHELLSIKQKGGVVLKTPHVGNIYPNNLAIASLGIPTLCYDRNIGERDKIFHPSKIIYEGRAFSASDPSLMVSHARNTRLVRFGNFTALPGQKMHDIHMSYFKQSLHSKVDIFTYTEYIQSNRDKVIELLELVANSHPHLWSRVVDAEGCVKRVNAQSFADIESLGIYGLTNMSSGWLIPNPVNILLHCTVDALKHDTKEIYLLSGPDMYKYVDSYKDELNVLYQSIKEKLNWGLPDVLSCYVVPVLDMRFVVESKNKELLDLLIDLYLKLDPNKDCSFDRDSFTKSDVWRKKFLESKSASKDNLRNHISMGYEVFKKNIFYNTDSADYFTQYDLINSNESLYIHPWAIHCNMLDLMQAHHHLRRYFNLFKEHKTQAEHSICR